MAGTAYVTAVNPGAAASNALAFIISGGAAHLTSLSPSTIPAGRYNFGITLYGTGFVTGAVVDWNGAALATSFVSATQLTATVPASDLTTAGSDTVTVSIPAHPSPTP